MPIPRGDYLHTYPADCCIRLFVASFSPHFMSAFMPLFFSYYSCRCPPRYLDPPGRICVNFTDDGQLVVSPTAEDITESFRGEFSFPHIYVTTFSKLFLTSSYRPTRDRRHRKRRRKDGNCYWLCVMVVGRGREKRKKDHVLCSSLRPHSQPASKFAFDVFRCSGGIH